MNEYTDYSLPVEDFYEDHLGFDANYRPCDMPTSPTMNVLLLGAWGILCAIGLAVVLVVDMPVVGAIIIVIPTLIGMVLKPTFAVCVFMLALPTADGIAIPGVFSLGRGIGIAVALSFLLNIMMTRPPLHLNHKTIWTLIGIMLLMALNIPRGSVFLLEFLRFFQMFQLVFLFLIVYWVVTSNGFSSFLSVLKSYLLGIIAMLAIGFVRGIEYTAYDSQGRFSATLGEDINANFLSGMVVMALFAAIYLLIVDRGLFWKILYLVSIPFMLAMLVRMGSRGSLVALAVTIVSPVFFIKDIYKRPGLLIMISLIVLVFGGGIAYSLGAGRIQEEVRERFTDVYHAQQSIGYRVSLIKTAIATVIRNPMGTTYSGWFQKTGLKHFPHSDLFFMLGAYGFIGAALFCGFIISMALAVKKMPFSAEKLYARAVLTYLVIVGFNNVFMFRKFYLVFMGIILACSMLYSIQNQFESTYYLDKSTPEDGPVDNKQLHI